MSDKFKYRSAQAEYLDAPDVPAMLLLENLRELDIFNLITGSYRSSIKGLSLLLKDKLRTYTVTDLGCGSGEWLRYAAMWARKNGFNLKFMGVDSNHHAIEFLENESKDFPEISGYVGDYKKYLEMHNADIFHCSLFCHHLNDEDFVKLLRHMNDNATAGFIINDLQRNRLAYYGAKLFITLFNGTSLARHDGPVSVLRGFKRSELNMFLSMAGVAKYKILEQPFFKFLILGGKGLEVNAI